MYNPDHPSGSAYYGEEIANMPLLEAITDETQVMRWKIITLPKGTSRMPTISVSPRSLTLNYGETSTITPNTKTYVAGFNNAKYGYTCILANADVARLEVDKLASSQNSLGTVPSWMDDSSLRKSATAVGMTFLVTAKDVTALAGADRTTTITVIGNETGGQSELTLTVYPITGSLSRVS